MEERPPYRHPRLAFALYCLQRWTVDLAADAFKAIWRRSTTRR